MLLVSTLAGIMDLAFNRVQFTPDLMPSDITGTDILKKRLEASSLPVRQGPIFTHPPGRRDQSHA
jgi:MoxR-like ATPase